jgi:hypothetical protein
MSKILERTSLRQQHQVSCITIITVMSKILEQTSLRQQHPLPLPIALHMNHFINVINIVNTLMPPII